MQPYLIYILLLGAVVFVGALIMPRKPQQAAMPEQAVQNMENALDQFMENMEKEHEELIALIAKSQHEAKVEADHKERRISELERKCEELERKLAEPPAQAAADSVVRQAMPPKLSKEENIAPAIIPAPAPEPAITIQSRYAELFKLYDQGKSIEMISKKLGMNKGEVQLIMQLAKQEAAANA